MGAAVWLIHPACGRECPSDSTLRLKPGVPYSRLQPVGVMRNELRFARFSCFAAYDAGGHQELKRLPGQANKVQLQEGKHDEDNDTYRRDNWRKEDPVIMEP